MRASLAPSEVCASPGIGRRWREEAIAWIEWKRTARGQYLGRNGDEAVRFIGRVGELLERSDEPRSPRTFADSDVLRVATWMGSAPKTKRTYLCLLSAFLEHRGNDAVRRSGLVASYSREATHRRWLSEVELERLTDRAVGIERLVIGLEGWQGFRRIEVIRARVADVDVGAGWIQARGKAHRGEPSRAAPLSDQLRRELQWYLPLRASWAASAKDCPELLAWADAGKLRPYSAGSIDRFVRSAGRRAGLVVSNHDLRRTFGRILKNRGADWREIAGLYGHASIAQSEYYVGQERDRLVAAIALLGRSR